MAEVFFAAHVKCGPAGIGHPAVLFGKTVCQEGVANRARKGYVNDSTSVHISEFCASQKKFLPSEAVWLSGDLRPCRNFVLEHPCQVIQHSKLR